MTPSPRLPEYALPGLALLTLAGLAGLAAAGGTDSADRRVLLALRTPGNPADPLGPGWLEEMARDVTGLGSVVVLAWLTLGLAGVLFLSRQRGAALLALGSVAGGGLLSFLLKGVIERPRPDLVPHAVAVYTSSFPSSHAVMSATAYLTLGALAGELLPLRRARSLAFGLAVATAAAVGVSRVYLGVHWPSDVLAGWCAGGTWAWLCALLARHLRRARSVAGG